MQLLVATNNDHKRNEFADIFAGHDLVTPRDLGVSFDVDETGTSFLENALLKAHQLRAALAASDAPDTGEMVIIADDSGICVSALAGAPGIYSARFGSPDGGKTELGASARNELLLAAMEHSEDRSAHFVCCMVALPGSDRILVAQETWEGEIARRPSTSGGGFGYDPVFYLPAIGYTAADLAPEEKNRLSHRGRASRVLAAALGAALDLPS